MTVGEKIYALRTQAGYSQEEFAELVGVSRQSVSKWETSAAMPDTEYIVKICKILLISTDTLLMESDLPSTVVETLQTESQQEEEFSKETDTRQQTVNATQKKSWCAMSIVGFVLSFFFGIVGLILSCVALRQEKQSQGAIDHLAVSGVAISSAKIYATIVFAIVYGALHSVYGGLL